MIAIKVCKLHSHFKNQTIFRFNVYSAVVGLQKRESKVEATIVQSVFDETTEATGQTSRAHYNSKTLQTSLKAPAQADSVLYKTDTPVTGLFHLIQVSSLVPQTVNNSAGMW